MAPRYARDHFNRNYKKKGGESLKKGRELTKGKEKKGREKFLNNRQKGKSRIGKVIRATKKRNGKKVEDKSF